MTANTNTENIAKYKAIGLIGRQDVDKLLQQGLVVVGAEELEKLRQDLNTQTQLNKEAQAFCLCQGWRKVDLPFSNAFNYEKG